MRPFRVLLVDDEKPEREKGHALNGVAGIELVASESLESARSAAVEGFFHLALVDLQLDVADDKNIDGQFFLRELLEGRPSCRRVLFTRTSSKHREAMFGLLDPDGAVIHGALDKSDYQRTWQEWVSDQAQKWRKPELTIVGLDELEAALTEDVCGKEAFGGKGAAVTRSELEYLVTTLFRHGSPGTDIAPFEVDGVSLETLDGGESSAAVLLARLNTGKSATRVACVLKVAPREESIEESGRYERLVKFRVAPDRRAELLDSTLADTVGGVVYAFVGESPERVHDLRAVFDREGEEGLAILTELFGAKGDDLWREFEPPVGSQRTTDLGKYFFDAYHLKAEDVSGELIAFVANRAKALDLESKGNELIGEGRKIALPPEGFYGGAKVRRPYVEAFIHGDLNARNVLVSDDGRVRLIDFRYADFGPLATDIAALEASVRARTGAPRLSGKELLAVAKEEQRVISDSWGPASSAPADIERPYWARISSHLVSQARRVSPSMSREEYIATCLLYALRIGRVSRLKETRRMRLIPWIAALYGALER
jgi:CheY-like chemotaxis protein